MVNKKVGFLSISPLDDSGYRVYNAKGVFLGIIKFNQKWKNYVFMPQPNTYYDAKCLEDLTTFLNEADKEGVAVE